MSARLWRTAPADPPPRSNRWVSSWSTRVRRAGSKADDLAASSKPIEPPPPVTRTRRPQIAHDGVEVGVDLGRPSRSAISMSRTSCSETWRPSSSEGGGTMLRPMPSSSPHIAATLRTSSASARAIASTARVAPVDSTISGSWSMPPSTGIPMARRPRRRTLSSTSPTTVSVEVVTHVTEQRGPGLAGADDQQPLADGVRVTAAGGDGLPAQHPGPEPDRTCEPARQDRGHDRDRERDRPPQQQHQGQQHREHDHLDHEDLPRLQDAGEPEQSGVEPHDGVAAEREDEDHGHEAEEPGPRRPRHIPVVAQEQCSRPRQHDQQYVPHEQRSRCARPRLHFIPT